MIFAREVSDPLTSLVKTIDRQLADSSARHRGGNKLGVFVIFVSDDPALEKQLKEISKKEKIDRTVLTIDNPAGPTGYDIPKDADVTVVLYTKRTVKSNYAFRKGELNDEAVERIVADIPKILPKK